MELGYARVSTSTQDLARQIDALTKAGIDPANIYVDKKSGATTEHPGLLALLAYARTGDVIVVHTLDRIARTVFLPPCGRHFTELRIETARVPPHVAAAGIGRVPLSDTGGCGQWSAGHHSPSPRWGFLACLTEGSLFGVVLYLLLGVASTLGLLIGLHEVAASAADTDHLVATAPDEPNSATSITSEQLCEDRGLRSSGANADPRPRPRSLSNP